MIGFSIPLLPCTRTQRTIMNKNQLVEAHIARSSVGRAAALMASGSGNAEGSYSFWPSGKRLILTQIDFKLLSDILAKSVTVKAGSFDAVTHERFLMMTAINGGVKINWGRLLLNIFTDMVMPGSRKARGYAVQICILLNNVPNLDLGDSKEFPPLKILTARTVGRYISINDKISIEDVEDVGDVSRVKKTPVKRAVSKKRHATAAAELVEL
ncbi:zinc finger protein 6-like [Dorcoceras hygrometricum]|uniref:Zinc finger protein 6-like n=1 Tax=Dorcoceras hygrometricum TaxID=472368 RepID=A0A2Z7ADX9_9LAMI|nr:zinc finger protein 6-like [Dorcoceras hygrometricum]